MYKTYEEILNNIDEVIATQKFETVLDTVYDLVMKEWNNAEMRMYLLEDALELIFDKVSPYYRKKMMNNCFSKPYSKWFEVLLKVVSNKEAKRIHAAKKLKHNHISSSEKEKANQIIRMKFRDILDKSSVEDIIECFYTLVVFYENEILLGDKIDKFSRHIFDFTFDFTAKFRFFLCRVLFDKMYKDSKYRLAAHFAYQNIVDVYEESFEDAVSEWEKLLEDETNLQYTSDDKEVCRLEIQNMRVNFKMCREFFPLFF